MGDLAWRFPDGAVMPFEVEVVADSIAEHSPRLTTFRLRYPKFIHGEFMTHRCIQPQRVVIARGPGVEEFRGGPI